jgi:hypothetical protein
MQLLSSFKPLVTLFLDLCSLKLEKRSLIITKVSSQEPKKNYKLSMPTVKSNIKQQPKWLPVQPDQIVKTYCLSRKSLKFHGSASKIQGTESIRNLSINETTRTELKLRIEELKTKIEEQLIQIVSNEPIPYARKLLFFLLGEKRAKKVIKLNTF